MRRKSVAVQDDEENDSLEEREEEHYDTFGKSRKPDLAVAGTQTLNNQDA